MKKSFNSDSNKEKTKLDLSYKYGKLYAINLEIDKEEKDLYKLKSSLKDNKKYNKSIDSKENELENSKDTRNSIFKELSDVNKEL